VLFTATATVMSRVLPDRFRSETLILVVPQRIPETYVRSTVTSRIEDRLSAITQQILSRTRLERIIEDFGLYAEMLSTTAKEDVVDRMRDDIQVQIIEGDAFRVSYQANDPVVAMTIADRLAALFIEENLRDREVLAKGTSVFLESQLADARRRLVEHETQIEQYRREHAGELPSQLEFNLQVIQNTQVQLQFLADSLNRDRDRQLLVERSIADLSAEIDLVAAPSDGNAPEGAPLAVQLERATNDLRALELRLKPEHPDVIRGRRLVQNLQQAVRAEATNRQEPAANEARVMTAAEMNRRNRLRELQAERDSLDRQIAYKTDEEARLRTVVADYQTRVESAPSRESELTALTRDYETLRETYTTLLAKGEDSKIAENLERRQIGEQFKILDPASLPEQPFTPNRPLIMLLGAFAGAAVGLLLVALLEYRDRSLKTEADILAILSVPVLAMIPRMWTTAERRALRRRRVALCAAAVAVTVVVAFVLMQTLRA
jgi:polysaccharide chain length determinant protein (PEP-CTERM system associated)